MKRALSIVMAGILAPFLFASMKYYALELHGGSRIYANDLPLRKGRLILFHRYPDGAYMSLSAAEVERVLPADPPEARSGKLTPGETLYIGSFLEGPTHEPELPVRTDTSVVLDYGSGGYSGLWFGGYVPPSRPPTRPNSVPSSVGSNGFPILAPPGFAGSLPPVIGSNGFPILAPPPAAVVPPRR